MTHSRLRESLAGFCLLASIPTSGGAPHLLTHFAPLPRRVVFRVSSLGRTQMVYFTDPVRGRRFSVAPV